MTPYSALASGRLSRKPGETSPRLEQDAYAKFKYDATRDQAGGGAGGEAGRHHDGDLPGLVAD